MRGWCSGREMICAMCHVEAGEREEVRDGMRRMLMIPYRMEAFMYILLYVHVSLSLSLSP